MASVQFEPFTQRPMLACLLLMSLAAACRPASDASPARRVILISCDTLRADHLSMYGFEHATSPHLDAFARDAVVYDEAFSCAPLTGPALSSLLSGRMPDEVGVSEGNRFLMPAEVRTLAEVCVDARISTSAVVSNWVLRKLDPSIGDVGVQQGFQSFDDRMSTKEQNRDAFERIAPDTTEAALRWLDGAKQRGDDRFFFWVHYQDPHGPYTPPARFVEPLPSSSTPTIKLPLGRTNKGKGQLPKYQVVAGEDDPAAYRARYQGEIRYFDESVGKLLAWLAAHDWYKDSLIIFTADHGESLGEHDYWFCHGENVYREEVHVPLLIRFPDGASGPKTASSEGFRRVGSLVSHLDLWPTIGEALGLSTARNRGTSLFTHELPENRVAVETLASVTSPARWFAISDGEHRLIVEGAGPPRLFDARRDLDEAHDLALASPDVVQKLTSRYHAFLAESPAGTAVGKPMQADPRTEEALKRLGYTEGHDGD